MCGSALVPVRMFCASSAACTSLAGREVFKPSRKPAPCTPVTGPMMQLERIYADTCRTFASSDSDSMVSITASATAHAMGPPPNVVPMSSYLSCPATRRDISRAETGKPFPRAFAAVIMSGVTP